ncbi:glycosyltransferase family 4 protein [Sulfuricurvum sp.]|uniref:glycosyltransferase family 4 protein n=1 Tax=Sulfuricurvum sp. TaxID=2025608 RepID=UPI00262F263B|nr:glycosyltransferase family 4 protein [Sulfuricurvum sp.]MDD3597077.1 glycosyltransferase family 4 protein [Sulfuricurvum sp.]
MINKPKLLCILHVPPPHHGAAKVGEFIRNSHAINETFECRFIPIRSSDTIADIGKVNWKKLYFVIELYLKVLWALIMFRPDKIYFTASIRSVAFYRDLLISTLWKSYRYLASVEIFYHYHTKGVDEFVSASARNLALTRFFLRDIRLILLSPMLSQDFRKIDTIQDISYLPNGVENTLSEREFNQICDRRYDPSQSTIHALYLSNMIKSKGYFDVLKAAIALKNNIHFHFAGGWQNDNDRIEFFETIAQHDLHNVTFHGFINGAEKQKLFEQSHLFIFPTRYPNEAFPLSLLEALSYGIPCIATDEGSIPYILNQETGIVIQKAIDLIPILDTRIGDLLHADVAKQCRKRYLELFDLTIFESNFIRIFNGSK